MHIQGTCEVDVSSLTAIAIVVTRIISDEENCDVDVGCCRYSYSF